MRPSFVALCSLVVFALTSMGCGETHITEGEAEEGWRVINRPLQEGQQRVQEKAQDLGLKLLTRDEPVTVTEACETSGDAKFELDVITSGGDASVQNPRVDFTVNFRRCEDLETVADGELDIQPPDDFGRPSGSNGIGRPLSHTLDDEDTGTDADGDASGKPGNAIGYKGDLGFVGDVDGPCPVDMHVITANGQPSYGGTWCGYNADDVLGFSFGG